MIIAPVIEIFRQKSLKKWVSKNPTEIIPLSRVKTVSILMDVEAMGFQDSMEKIASKFKSMGYRPEFHFFDFRRLEKDELLLTSITNTILKKDLNWYGMPDPSHIVDIQSDLFICLVDSDAYAVRFFSSVCRCRFKVGCHGWEDHPYDLLVKSRPGATPLEIFNEMMYFINRFE